MPAKIVYLSTAYFAPVQMYSKIMNGKAYIEKEDLRMPNKATSSTTNFHEQVLNFKCKLIEEALLSNEGNQVKAAKAIGLDRSTLRRIINRNS